MISFVHLDSKPQRGYERLQLVVLVDPLRRALLDVEDLASQRQDRLRLMPLVVASVVMVVAAVIVMVMVMVVDTGKSANR